MFVRNDAACDTSSGEANSKHSPGKSPSLEACQRSCEAAADCQRITFSNAELCSHFSTSCSKTKWNKKAVALQLSFDMLNHLDRDDSGERPTIGGHSNNLSVQSDFLSAVASVRGAASDNIELEALYGHLLVSDGGDTPYHTCMNDRGNKFGT